MGGASSRLNPLRRAELRKAASEARDGAQLDEHGAAQLESSSPTRSLERERDGESDGPGAQRLVEQTEADRRRKERRSTRDRRRKSGEAHVERQDLTLSRSLESERGGESDGTDSAY